MLTVNSGQKMVIKNGKLPAIGHSIGKRGRGKEREEVRLRDRERDRQRRRERETKRETDRTTSIHSSIYSLIHLFIHPFTHSFIRPDLSFPYTFIHLAVFVMTSSSANCIKCGLIFCKAFKVGLSSRLNVI